MEQILEMSELKLDNILPQDVPATPLDVRAVHSVQKHRAEFVLILADMSEAPSSPDDGKTPGSSKRKKVNHGTLSVVQRTHRY